MSNFIKLKLSNQIKKEGRHAKDALGVSKIYLIEKHDGSALSYDHMINFIGKGVVTYQLVYSDVKTLMFIRDAIRNKEYYGYDSRGQLVKPID